jgi:hypothetical protein
MVMVNPRTIKPRMGRLEFPGTGLPAGTSFQPMESQYFVSGVTQPGCNFPRLKRPLSRTKVAIEQLGNFFSRAWLLILFSARRMLSSDLAATLRALLALLLGLVRHTCAGEAPATTFII